MRSATEAPEYSISALVRPLDWKPGRGPRPELPRIF